MAMGLSTQTGPLRPSCPSYSLFSRSCSRPSSFPFSWSLLASSKALHREGGWTIQNNKNYQTMSKSWRLLCLSNSAKMVFYSIDQDNSSAVVADKSADLGGIREWKEEVKRVRSTRQAGSNPPRGMSSRASSRNVGRQSINHAAPVSALKPASATSSGPASTGNVRIVSQPIVFPSRNLDEIKETSSEVNVNGLNLDQSRPGLCSTDNSQKLAQLSVSTDGLDKTSTSNEAYRQPDLHERLKSNPPRRTSSRASSRNAGRQSISHAAPVSASKPASATPSGLASTDNVRIVSQPSLVESRNLEETKETNSEVNVNGLNLDQSRSGLCSTDNSQKVAQPSVSTDGLDKTSTSNEAYRQPDLLERLNSIYDSVLVVDNITVAKEVVGMLTNKYRHLVHACDTEVAKIDVKQETPVDHGEIICFSIYSGPEADLGNGKSCVWVDVLDGGGRDLLVEFAPFFEDPSIKKVWHNYSFDNHVIENYGLRLSGFHADTMHMARLWDSSRRTEGGYSLEALTGNKRVMCGAQLCHEQELFGKVSMKTIFGRRKIKKDGSAGKMITISPVEEIQREERKPWICYSALDAKSTLKLYESLKCKLSKMPWVFNDKKISGKSMFDFYEEYWRPFGEILVKMETEGMLVDRAYLAEVEKVAKGEQVVAASRFRNWASRYCPDAKYMNVGSDTQLRQLFFGGIANSKEPNEFLPNERIFKVPNVDKVIEDGKKTPTKFCDIKLHRIPDFPLPTDTFTATGWPSVSGDVLRTLAGKVSAEYDFMDHASDQQLDDNVENASENEVSEKQKSTGDVDKSAYGTAFQAFEEEEGREACHAIAALCEVCSIDSLISNFIVPLQESNISGSNGRIHCSLNINTETGRLSARRPNLQNQPALEKDRYKIRQAFIAAPGNSLIVADYGQLELRILAHLASCKSMLDAFRAGGDFHSRTAMNMYPYIREAVDKKEVLLEWYPQPGEEKPPVPLLKDAFASERRKAKMLNFSIAYGKTPVGLARDWKVSVKEAKKTVDLWYSDRKEVLTWQEQRKKEARDKQFVRTLLGRARRFPSVANVSTYQKGHIERAAINTPVQGSAADVAMCAMLEITKNVRLKELGWKLLLQVHDEVILEGPTETAEVAKAIVVDCMAKPFNGKNFLQVDLSVDAKCAKNWYSAK